MLKRLQTSECKWVEFTCVVTARIGHLEVLMWGFEHGSPWDEKV